MNEPIAVPARSQFGDSAQRAVANRLGLWGFLATEVLLFGGLFTSYAVYRHTYPAVFAAGSQHLDFWIGTLNTVILLTSSLAMAFADHAIRCGRRDALRRFLAFTWLLGAAFLALKGWEYFQKYSEHLIPGPNFRDAVGVGPPLQLFFFLYFVMTGLHALHMLVGLAVIAWLLRLNHRGRLSAAHHAPVEMTGLYWHFVDCVWVFLYPLLYLIPRG